MIDKSPFFSTIANVAKPSSNAITAEQVNAIPYASLLAWFEGQSRALLVLGEYLPEDRLVWYSAEKQALTTWGPFPLALVGTEVELRSTTLIGNWNKDPRQMAGRRFLKTMAFQTATNRVTVSATSRFKIGDVEEIKVFGVTKRARRVEEHVIADKWHNYRNDYWIDEQSGKWLKTRQTVVPTMRPLTLIVAKMPARG